MIAWASVNVTATPWHALSTRVQSEKLPQFYMQIAFTFWIPFVMLWQHLENVILDTIRFENINFSLES